MRAQKGAEKFDTTAGKDAIKKKPEANKNIIVVKKRMPSVVKRGASSKGTGKCVVECRTLLSAVAKRSIGQAREYAKAYNSARKKANSRLTQNAAPIMVIRKSARQPIKVLDYVGLCWCAMSGR